MDRFSITGAKIISFSDMGPLPAGYLTIANGHIEKMGDMGAFRPDGETILEMDGMTILPGLIDSHCHLISATAHPITEQYITSSTLEGVQAARLALEDGLTSVRDVGCRHGGIYSLKEAVEAGQIPGPRFQTAGRPLAGTGITETWRSHSYDGPVEVLRGVRREWEAGANWIKLSISDGRWRPTQGWQDTPLFSQAEITAAVNEAHAKDLRVACHVDGPVGAKLAVTAGADSIEHGVSIPDDLLAIMADQGIFFVPTVWIYSTKDLKVFQADLGFLNDLHRNTIARARSAGVTIAAGVDYSYHTCPPLEGLLYELETLIDCGLTEIEALKAATVHGASLLGWEKSLGSLAPGKLADMIIVRGDPTLEITTLRALQLVLQNGRIVADKRPGAPPTQPARLPSLIPSWMS